MIKKIIKYTFVFILFWFLSCPIVNASTKIELTRTIDKVSNNVSNVFTYEIRCVNNENMQDEVRNIDVEFNNLEPVNNKVSSKVNIDFSDITYDSLGVYEYIITEVSSSNEKTFPISSQEYKVFVEVSNDSGDISIRVHPQALDLETNEKTALEFSNQAKYTKITIQNAISGRLVDKNEYFRYKVTILGNVGDIYNIKGQDEIVYYNGKIIHTDNSYIVKEQDNYMYIYLKDDQKLTIGELDDILQIPIGVKYTISKVDSLKWKTTMNGNMVETISLITDEENLVSILNTRDFDIAITGVFIDSYPFIILIVLEIVGVFVIIKFKKKSDEYGK